MQDLSDFTTDDIAADANRAFLIRRAAELSEQMDRFNQPGSYPSNTELQTWAGAATAILKMVAEDA